MVQPNMKAADADFADAKRLAQMADEFECEDMARRCDSFLAGPMVMAAVRMDCSQVLPPDAGSL